MEVYETETLHSAREKYFQKTGFSEKDYSAKWVKLNLGPIPFFFPNTTSRKSAIPRHDLHHILTGYETNWIGEAEIGAWELASGCKKEYAAWVLNFLAVVIGLFINCKKVARAFANGRKTKNLYGQPYDTALLNSTVGEIRKQCHIITPSSPTQYPAPSNNVVPPQTKKSPVTA